MIKKSEWTLTGSWTSLKHYEIARAVEQRYLDNIRSNDEFFLRYFHRDNVVLHADKSLLDQVPKFTSFNDNRRRDRRRTSVLLSTSTTQFLTVPRSHGTNWPLVESYGNITYADTGE